MVEGLLIAPDWEESSFSKLKKIIEDRPLIGSEYRFSVGRSINGGHAYSKNLRLQELVNAYGTRAVEIAKNEGERRHANMCLLHSKKGYKDLAGELEGTGELEITASYYFF